MASCNCTHKNHLSEDTNDFFAEFEGAILDFTKKAKKASLSSDGQKLKKEYWTQLFTSLKKAKVGISVSQLGLDPEDTGDEPVATTKDMKLTPMGDTRDGDQQFDVAKDEEEGKEEEAEKEKEEAEKEKEKEDKTKKKKVDEKATSASQQRLFGMVHSYKKGELEKDEVDADLYAKIKKIAKNISNKDAKKIAKTKHKSLPEKVPTDEYYDTLNHLSILLSEEDFNKVEGTGTGFIVEKNDRKFTIEFDQNFYMKSDNYNFEIGDVSDLSEVVKTFNKLISYSDSVLKKDYESSL